MALKLRRTVTNDKGDAAKIYWDTVWCEYCVKFTLTVCGYLPDADYFTNDEADAIATAERQLNVKG